MFGALVVEMGLNPDYVLDEMDDQQLNAIIKAYNKKFKQEQEQQRLQYWLIFHSNPYAKRVELQKFMPFEWEKERKKINYTKAELEERWKKAKEMEDNLNKVDNN